jgi:hypothetical protein
LAACFFGFGAGFLATGLARRTGFLAAGFAAAGLSSANTGLGRSRGGSPAPVTTSSCSASVS